MCCAWSPAASSTAIPPFECALAVFGPDRILFSVDYPWGDPTQHARFLADAPIAPDARDKIAHRNAERLFHLPSG